MDGYIGRGQNNIMNNSSTFRKGPPEAMDGQSNDVYEEMERSKKVSQLPGGMAILYASAPIFSPTSKDPEGKDEVYQILPEAEAVQQGVDSRR
jgi:hypothetical protein